MSQTGLMYIFMGIIIGVFIVNFVFGIRSVKAIQVKEFEELITTERVIIDTKIEVLNNSKRTYNFIKLYCNQGVLISIEEIKGKQVKHITPELIFNTRGIYPVNKMYLVSGYPFGLLKIKRNLKGSGLIKVYPGLYYCSSPVASGFEPMLGGHYKGSHSTAFGDDFFGIKPYIAGDPVKFIHWKASSKGMGIFVKEFSEEYSGRISCILQLENKFLSKNDNILDWAVRAAGSLSFAALDLGHSIGITDFSFRHSFKASPFTNFAETLEFLTALKHEKDNNILQLEFLDKLPGKTSLVFILVDLNSELIDFIEKISVTKRKIEVYLPSIYEKQEDKLARFLRNNSIFYYDREKIWKG